MYPLRYRTFSINKWMSYPKEYQILNITSELQRANSWIRLLLGSKYLTKNNILEECETIIKILTKILITAKENENK